jgi:hypothetical protein
MAVTINPSHATTQGGMYEEFSMRRLLFGDDKTDIMTIIDRKFCARVGTDGDERPSLWFGKVLGFELGHGTRMHTTVGTFALAGGSWKLVLQNGNAGATTEFDFENV